MFSLRNKFSICRGITANEEQRNNNSDDGSKHDVTMRCHVRYEGAENEEQERSLL